MKKNESKAESTAAAAEKTAPEQKPENTQSVAAAEAPDTESEAGTDVAGQDVPSDGKGCEGVTVIVVETQQGHPERAKISARSVKQNLVGADAMVVIMGYDPEMAMVQALKRMLKTFGTERIILMTDAMFILNPVMLGDISVLKAKKVGEAYNFNTNTPVLMHKSALEDLIDVLVKEDLLHTDVTDAYFRGILPTNFTPVFIGNWTTDPWLLPVISKNPAIDVVKKFAAWKKFMHVGPDSWSKGLVKFLEERFPE